MKVLVRARTPNTDQHKHRHVTTPKGAKRLLKMACNKVCMTARCVYGCVFVLGRAREQQTHQTPTCTPIILDGLAVKCVMWGSVSGARATHTNHQH